VPQQGGGGAKSIIGRGVDVGQVSRVNDEYLEKQLNNGTRDLSHFEEKEFALKGIEDVFNEMNGDGINRLMSRFFNEFRKLANDPNSEAVRTSVREATQALVNDFHRIRKDVDEIRGHLDNRIQGYAQEANSLAEEIKDLNLKIKAIAISGGSPNDLLDQRDIALKKLSGLVDVTHHKDENGSYNINIRGIGPLVAGSQAEKFSVERTPADTQGKPENAYDIKTSASAAANVTHELKGGKIGALLEVRDKTLSGVLDKLDELAFGMTESVNQIHQQGVTRNGVQGVKFFRDLPGGKFRAAEYIGLSDEVRASVNNIATAAQLDAPGDNRIAHAISGLQGLQLMNEGKATADDWYNSIVSDVGIIANRNREALNQQKNINTQLSKLRDQLSGVSIDEETANLLQFQHSFDASAKVISIADDCLKTVLNLR
jgi:flagellar hook-associated protein 1 FlgK